jgi:hypothetical protein
MARLRANRRVNDVCVERRALFASTWRSSVTESGPTDEAVVRHRRQLEHELGWAGPDAVAIG